MSRTKVAQLLVGREEELRRIDQFLALAEEGPASLLLEGPPGIGKTTLWRTGVERAAERGFLVLEARPAEPERELSFAALGDLLTPVHDQIGGLPSPQRRALRAAILLDEPRGSPPDDCAIAAACAGLFSALSAESALVIALDDAQWLDSASRAALEFALRRAPATALVARRLETDGIKLDSSERLSVQPFSPNEIAQLLRVHLGTDFLRPTVLAVHRTSGGNPFFALELGRALIALPEPLRADEPLPVPDNLRDLVRVRLDALGPDERRAALLAATAFQPTEEFLARAGATALEGLLASQVLIAKGGRLEFSHPLLAAAAYASADDEERAQAHLSLAQVCDDDEERAHHLATAALEPDAEVAAALSAAAAQARARGATDSSARNAARAVELTPPEDREQLHQRRLTAAAAWVTAGEPGRAIAVLEEGLEAEPSFRAETHLHLARVYDLLDSPARVREIYESALEELDAGDVRLRTECTLGLSSTLEWIGDLEAAHAHARVALELAEQLANATLLSRALARVFWLGFLRGVEEVALIERALQLETLETSSVATELYVAYLMHTYRLDEARRAQLRLLAAARRVGDAREGEFLMGLGWVELRAGRWDEALSCADAAIELNRQTGRVYEETYSHYLRAWVNVYRGEVEDAERDAHIVIRTGERLESELCLSYGRAVLGNVAFARGDYELALEHLSASGIWDGAGDPALSPGLPQRAQMLIALGRSEEIRPSLDLYERSCRDLDRCVHLAAALRSQALMAAASGNFPLADEICAESLDQYDRIDVPFERAQTLLVRGRIARRARKKSAAQVALAEALGIFEALGAKLWAQAARDEIAQIGGRASSPGKLTPAEERIAELVASGRSNTEVAHQLSLSPKTVEWNLSKVYKKLHVRSRTELAAKLAKR